MRPFVSLRTQREFSLAMRRGAAASTPALTLHVFSPPARTAGAPKVGVVVTRKVGKAVVRNKIRRRCKAVLESLLTRSDANWYVIACKPRAATLGFAELRRQLVDAMPRATRARGRA